MRNKESETPPSSDDSSVEPGEFREATDDRIGLNSAHERWVEKSIPMVSATAPEPAPPSPPATPPLGAGADENTGPD